MNYFLRNNNERKEQDPGMEEDVREEEDTGMEKEEGTEEADPGMEVEDQANLVIDEDEGVAEAEAEV